MSQKPRSRTTDCRVPGDHFLTLEEHVDEMALGPSIRVRVQATAVDGWRKFTVCGTRTRSLIRTHSALSRAHARPDYATIRLAIYSDYGSVRLAFAGHGATPKSDELRILLRSRLTSLRGDLPP
eukprot:scaffold53728_cov40-Prasinocladus_malaysianus.AAC.1